MQVQGLASPLPADVNWSPASTGVRMLYLMHSIDQGELAGAIGSFRWPCLSGPRQTSRAIPVPLSLWSSPWEYAPSVKTRVSPTSAAGSTIPLCITPSLFKEERQRRSKVGRCAPQAWRCAATYSASRLLSRYRNAASSADTSLSGCSFITIPFMAPVCRSSWTTYWPAGPEAVQPLSDTLLHPVTI